MFYSVWTPSPLHSAYFWEVRKGPAWLLLGLCRLDHDGANGLNSGVTPFLSLFLPSRLFIRLALTHPPTLPFPLRILYLFTTSYPYIAACLGPALDLLHH